MRPIRFILGETIGGPAIEATSDEVSALAARPAIEATAPSQGGEVSALVDEEEDDQPLLQWYEDERPLATCTAAETEDDPFNFGGSLD